MHFIAMMVLTMPGKMAPKPSESSRRSTIHSWASVKDQVRIQCGPLPSANLRALSQSRKKLVQETRPWGGHDLLQGHPAARVGEELIEARVLRAEYPAGYTPQRNTRQMVPLPKLEPFIDDLALYLK